MGKAGRFAGLLIIALAVAFMGGCGSNTGPEEDLPLKGPTWVLYSYGSVGYESRVQGSTLGIEIDFGDQGTLTGFTGCNSFSAQYVLSTEGDLTVSDIVGPPGICDEPLMTYERDMYYALTNLSGYTIEGSRLRLFYDNGSRNFVFDGR
ncbi:MAG: META domain-containing protein [candidate division Zixibacteria bacterium]|nr:META domain-containing protein [candidate division Zixibacteria bacterium]